MKVLFSHSYFYQFDSKQWANKTPYPPLGTIYAAACLRENGHEVALYDTALLPNHDSLFDKLDSFKPDLFVVYDDGFNYLTKMCLTNMREAACEMAKKASALYIKTAVCSSDSTDHAQFYLDHGFDFVIKGEGELSLLDLATTLQEKKEANGIAGVLGRDGQFVARPVLKELDELPQPAWDLIDIPSYKRVWQQGKHQFTMNLATTRGCPYKCNWCAKPIYGQRYNSRSPKRVVDEIEMHHKLHGVQKFWMCDDIFGLKPKWVQIFRDELKNRNLEISYTIQSRADLLLEDDNLSALAESGLYEAWIGAESGSQKILDAMDKGTKVEQIYEATRQLQKHGIRIAFFLQFGYIDESKEDIELTFKMLSELKPDNIGVSVSYPLPGTKFYDRVKDLMKDKYNWSDSDDLAMMYQNTFNPTYYKTLHRYVHKLYRKHYGIQNLKKLFRKNRRSISEKLRSIALIPYYTFQEIQFRKKLARLENTNS